MARKKNINEESIIKFYMEYVLTYGKKPDSVYSFSKQYNLRKKIIINLMAILVC